MENTDIIVLTSIVIVLFLVFIIATVREFSELTNKDYTDTDKTKYQVDFVKSVGSIFTDDSVDIRKKIKIIDSIKSALEDSLDEEKKDA